jgi:hypothetical protein
MIDFSNDQRVGSEIVVDKAEPRGDEPVGVVGGIHVGDLLICVSCAGRTWIRAR